MLSMLSAQPSSASGSIWTSSAFPNSKTAFSILFANNLFIAAPWDQSATYVQTSTDGINWTPRSIPVSGGWESIAYGNGIYVAVGDVGGGSASNKYIYSADGINWSASNTVPSGAVRDVAFGNGIFVATHGGLCSDLCIRTSTDGITWTQRTTPNTGNYRSVIYTGSAFYAGSNTGQGITSTDGLTWTSTSNIGNNTEELAYGAGVWVSVSNGSIYSSSNFSIWTQGTGFSASKNWQHVIYADSIFTAIASDGTINTSTNGSSWASDTSNLSSGGFLAFGAGKFVALSNTNSYATLVSRTIPSAPTALSASAGSGQATITFTAGSNGNSAITNYKYSLDGTTYLAFSPVQTTSPVTISGLTNGTSYNIYLKAVNWLGDGVASTSVAVTPVAVQPSAVGQTNNSLTFASSTANSNSRYLGLSPGINFGSSAFTFETYFKTGSVLDNGFFLGVGSGNGLSLNIYGPNEIQIDAFGINATVYVLPNSMQINTWYHLAVARDSSNNETVWLNGARATSAYNRWDRNITYGPVFVDSRNYNGNTTGINGSTACGHCNQNHRGDSGSDVDFNDVKITNFRVVVGSTVYDPNSATITLPNTPLANISNTKILLNVSNSGAATIDSSGFQTITNTGVTFSAAEKITPTFTWSNVSKTYGNTPFTLTAPTPSTPGSFTYSSATTSVISLTSDTATVVAPGTSVLTASFTPTDTSTYNSATTTMTVTVSKAAQSTLTFALSTASKNQPYSQAITMTPTGGTGTGAITYAITAGGTATSCALANATGTNTVTATSGGTCLIQVTKAADTNYLVATSATQTFTFNAPLSLTYAAGELGTGTVPTLSGTYFAGDTATVAAGSALNRSGFTFNGWRNASNTSVAAGSTFTFSTNDTLSAQWRQTSLFGLTDNEITELQSWNASANTNSGTVSNASSSYTVTVPGSSLPTGTTVKLWEVANSNLSRSKVGSDKDYIINLVLSWLKSDGTVPTATSPVTLAISNSTIKSGAIAYQIIGDTVTQIGTATADGVINLSVTEDPVITVVNPAVVAAASSGGSSGGSVGVSSAPVITETKPVEEIKKVEETKPVVLEQLKNILKMEHKVTFGLSAAWLDTKNIMAIRNFISKASEKIEIEKIVIKGFAQPTKISIPNIDIARANAVKKFLKREGINYPIVATGAGAAKTKKPASSRIAIVIIEGNSRS